MRRFEKSVYKGRIEYEDRVDRLRSAYIWGLIGVFAGAVLNLLAFAVHAPVSIRLIFAFLFGAMVAFTITAGGMFHRSLEERQHP